MPPASPLEFFIDRGLGRHIVPDALPQAGATDHPMANVYGERIGQGLGDEEWLRDAGTRGWVVLMKDARIRRRPAELEGLVAYQAHRLVRKLERITRIAETPGPYIYGVYSDAEERVCPR